MRTTAAIVVFICAAASSAGVVRPTTATATSEFSSSYDVGQAIDGSGLPEGFGPSTPHDIYRRGNHWTTRANPSLPVVATLSFAEPVDLGGFYLWNHRANGPVDGLGSGSDYDVTLFDLELLDASGNELLALRGCSRPSIARSRRPSGSVESSAASRRRGS